MLQKERSLTVKCRTMSSSQQIYNVIQEQYSVHELASSPKPSGMTQVLLVLGCRVRMSVRVRVSLGFRDRFSFYG